MREKLRALGACRQQQRQQTLSSPRLHFRETTPQPYTNDRFIDIDENVCVDKRDRGHLIRCGKEPPISTYSTGHRNPAHAGVGHCLTVEGIGLGAAGVSRGKGDQVV